MPCGCTTYQCLGTVLDYSNCKTVVVIKLQPEASATWQWQYEFNGIWKGGNIDVTVDTNITLPWVFNEYYVHTIQFFNNGELVNDTCYRLDTSKLAGSYSTNPPPSPTDLYLTFTVTSEMIGNNGATITNPEISGRGIVLISDGNQIYNTGGFTQAGDSFTMTNGVTYYAGQIITLLFG